MSFLSGVLVSVKSRARGGRNTGIHRFRMELYALYEVG